MAVVSVTVTTLLHRLFFQEEGETWGMMIGLQQSQEQSWLPKEPRELCQELPSALHHSRGESSGRESGREEERWELCSL